MAELGRREGEAARRDRVVAGAKGRALLLAVTVILGGLVLGSSIAAPSAHALDSVTVRILPSALDPASVSVAPGSTVTWVNGAGTPVSVVADDGSFDSGTLQTDETFQFVFPAVRTVPYHLIGVNGVVGTVEITATPAAPAPSATAAAPASPFTGPPAGPGQPTGLAFSGSAEDVNGAVGAFVLAGGVLLVAWARRRGFTLAWLGSPFGAADDLLPGTLPRTRRRPDRVRLGRVPRRSRHRV